MQVKIIQKFKQNMALGGEELFSVDRVSGSVLTLEKK